MKELVKELVKLQVLCMRFVERNTNLSCATHRDLDRILTSNKMCVTYLEGATNLKENIFKYCNDNKYLTESIVDLEEKIKGSEIKNLRFGLEPQKKFTDVEKNLANYMIKRTLFMLNEMVGIKYITDNFDLTEYQIKQACQQERLLNTRKVGKTWLVHIPEVLNYWGIKNNEDGLYKDWEY